MLLPTARKLIVALIGGTVVVIGVAMLVLPGPAFIVIPIGLTILGTEFLWARSLVTRVKNHAAKLAARRTSKRASPPSGPREP